MVELCLQKFHDPASLVITFFLELGKNLLGCIVYYHLDTDFMLGCVLPI